MLIGHEIIRERLWRAAEKGRTAHAYFFVGPENVGKRTTALELSASFLEQPIDLSDQILLQPERIEERGKVKEHPLGVETIREATRLLKLSSRNKKGKILIVDGAHRLTEGAQNALLKTLEEPFPGTTVFLITHEEGAILPTIVSRCERVPFFLVPEKIMSEHFPDIPKVVLHLGRPGLAIQFREQPDVFRENLLRLELLLSFQTLSLSDRAALAEALLNDISETERLLSWWIGALEQHLNSLSDGFERRNSLWFLRSVFATLRDLRRFPGSARFTIEHLLFFGKSVSPSLFRKVSAI